MRALALCLASAIAVACGSSAAAPGARAIASSSTVVPTPTPTGAPSASQVATPTLNPSFVVSPTPGARIARSDAALQTSAALVLFEFPGDDRLRGVAWDASASGVLGPRVAFPWFPSPDGMRYAAGGKVYERDGREIASLPWQDASFTWSSDGQLLCKALPEVVRTGSQMRVETLVPGQAPRTIASGFATYSDNAGYPVIACDPRSDRVVVVAAGQGLFAGHMWTFELSSGRLVRSATLGQGAIGSWLVATSDGAMLAHTVQATMDGTATTVVQRTDDGTALATLSDFQARGFSGDGSMLYGWASGNRVEIREWKTGRLVWSSTGYPPPYAVSVAAPGGARFAIAFGRDNTLKDTDLYLVSSDGTSRVLEHVTVIFP